MSLGQQRVHGGDTTPLVRVPRFQGTPRFVVGWLATLAATYPDLVDWPIRCVPPDHVFSVVWGQTNSHILVHPTLAAHLLDKTTAKRFSFWVGVFDTKGMGQNAAELHANAFLLDRVNRRLTRFEPQGTGWYSAYDERQIDGLLRTWARDALGATYLAPRSYQPQYGPQKQERDEMRPFGKHYEPEQGPCVLWSALFLHLTLEYPNASPRTVATFLSESDTTKVLLSQGYGHVVCQELAKLPVCKGKRNSSMLRWPA